MKTWVLFYEVWSLKSESSFLLRRLVSRSAVWCLIVQKFRSWIFRSSVVQKPDVQKFRSLIVSSLMFKSWQFNRVCRMMPALSIISNLIMFGRIAASSRLTGIVCPKIVHMSMNNCRKLTFSCRIGLFCWNQRYGLYFAFWRILFFLKGYVAPKAVSFNSVQI